MPASQTLLFPDPRPLVERLGQDFFRQLTERPGVYMMQDANGLVLYVGKAKNLRQRLGYYRVANPDRLGRRHLRLLRQVVQMQARTNQLVEELIQQQNQFHRQRQNELGQWKEANPELAKCCRTAAETLSRVQTEFLRNLTEEVVENEECLIDGEFMLNEFVDRYGPRLAHLNGVLQVLSQLSAVPN